VLTGISDFLIQVLVAINGFTGNFGLSIVVLTIAIRIVLLPLTLSQVRSTKRMQELQPQVKKLQTKYKNDPQRLNEETMKLWRENKVNPLSGCLPLLIQLPILWAFFRALIDFEGLQNASFLWIPDIGAADPLYILPILAGVATFLQTKYTTPTGADGSQKTMLYVMPVFIAWISARYPAGLALYWTVSSIFGALQQYFIPSGTGNPDPAPSEAGGK